MVRTLDSKLSVPGIELANGYSSCLVLGQDTLLPQCVAPPRRLNKIPANFRQSDKKMERSMQWTSIPPNIGVKRPLVWSLMLQQWPTLRFELPVLSCCNLLFKWFIL